MEQQVVSDFFIRNASMPMILNYYDYSVELRGNTAQLWKNEGFAVMSTRYVPLKTALFVLQDRTPEECSQHAWN